MAASLDQLYLRPRNPRRYDEQDPAGAELEFMMEQIAALRRGQGKLAFVILFVGAVHQALLCSVPLDLSRLPMGNLRSWAVYVAAVATGLAPGLLVLSTGFISRLLLRTAEMFQPKAEQLRRQRTTNHDLRWQV